MFRIIIVTKKTKIKNFILYIICIYPFLLDCDQNLQQDVYIEVGIRFPLGLVKEQEFVTSAMRLCSSDMNFLELVWDIL